MFKWDKVFRTGNIAIRTKLGLSFHLFFIYFKKNNNVIFILEKVGSLAVRVSEKIDQDLSDAIIKLSKKVKKKKKRSKKVFFFLKLYTQN